MFSESAKYLAAAAVVGLSCHAFNATASEASTDMDIKGTIRPTACSVSLSNDGQIDFGTVSTLTLSESNFTSMGNKDFSLSLICDASTKMAITASDNRKGTAVPGIGKFIFANQNDAATFGVGSVDGKPVGGMIVYRDQSGTGDGKGQRSVVSNNDGGTWALAEASNNALAPDTRMHAWATASSTTPGAYMVVEQPYHVRLALNKKSGLPALTTDVPIDGLITFSVHYL